MRCSFFSMACTLSRAAHVDLLLTVNARGLRIAVPLPRHARCLRNEQAALQDILITTTSYPKTPWYNEAAQGSSRYSATSGKCVARLGCVLLVVLLRCRLRHITCTIEWPMALTMTCESRSCVMSLIQTQSSRLRSSEACK